MGLRVKQHKGGGERGGRAYEDVFAFDVPVDELWPRSVEEHEGGRNANQKMQARGDIDWRAPVASAGGAVSHFDLKWTTS
jgi:hypothetical protein